MGRLQGYIAYKSKFNPIIIGLFGALRYRGGAQCADIETLVNGLQVKGGLFGREFTKSLMFRDFDDVLENSFRYVHLFLLHTLLSKKIAENRHA